MWQCEAGSVTAAAAATSLMLARAIWTNLD